MSTCLFTSGIPRECRDNAGGLRKVYLANKNDIVSVTPALGSITDLGVVTQITMATGTTFFEFSSTKESSNFVQNIQSNQANGTVGIEQVLSLTFSKMTGTKSKQIDLINSAEMVAIAEDYNGRYFLLGEFGALETNGGSAETGTALADLNGYKLTLRSLEKSLAREVVASAVTSVITVI